jgi:3-methylfumaryl-CoA hydratase
MKLDELQAWIGREDRQRDTIDLMRARRLHVLLDLPHDELQIGTVLPRGYHWLYCVSITPRAEWGRDGHARRGGFLPPLTGMRRMWAAGSLRFLEPLRIGDVVERHSAIEAIEEKEGRSGRFTLVRVAHRIGAAHGVALEEQQRLVYLAESTRPSNQAGKPFTHTPDWQDSFTTDEVTLFFFSALTMNGHRIHYDHPYATQQEGYPGLLVHAPLTALLLLAAARRHGHDILSFEYRASAPLFCGETITLAGKAQPNGALGLWALRGGDSIAMEATAAIASSRSMP